MSLSAGIYTCMTSLLLEILDCVDFTDEFILKCIKDVRAGNISDEEFRLLVTSHERRHKLVALKKENH